MGRPYKEAIKAFRESDEVVPEERRIIQIKPIKDRYHSCNICMTHHGIRKELRVGCNNFGISICICKSCLSKLGDTIWECLGGDE